MSKLHAIVDRVRLTVLLLETLRDEQDSLDEAVAEAFEVDPQKIPPPGHPARELRSVLAVAGGEVLRALASFKFAEGCIEDAIDEAVREKFPGI